MEWGVEPWSPEVAGTTLASLKSSAFLLLSLIVREDFLLHEADIFFFFWWDLGGLVNVIMSTKSLEYLGRKFKVFLLLLLVFQFP